MPAAPTRSNSPTTVITSLRDFLRGIALELREYRFQGSKKHAPHAGGMQGNHRTLSGCDHYCDYRFQGYAKNAYPWLISEHASGVRNAPLRGASFTADENLRVRRIFNRAEAGGAKHRLQTTARREPPITFITVEFLLDEIQLRPCGLIKDCNFVDGIIVP